MKIFKRNFDNKFWKELEFYRFSIMMFTITFSTCIGSIAVYYLFEQKPSIYFVPLSVVVLLSMASNAAAIAQTPIKWVIGMFLIASLTSFSLIIFALL